MKIYSLITLMLGIFALSLPFAVNVLSDETKKADEKELYSLEQSTKKEEAVEVIRTKSRKTESTEMLEYIIGCVAGEMPATYNDEALKAQAVASYSYAKYILESSSSTETSLTDSTRHQCYIDKSEQKKKWGDDYEEYRKKLENAVKAVFGELLTVNGKAAMTVFHAASPESTRSAEEIWGKAIAYLPSVAAPTEEIEKNSFSFSSKDFKEAFEKKTSVTLTEADPKKWARVTGKAKNGLITVLQIGEEAFTAAEIKDILSLPSASFTARLENDTFIFTTYGRGHGVGMSQTSAAFMADNGKTYKEILSHFYPGTELIEE